MVVDDEGERVYGGGIEAMMSKEKKEQSSKTQNQKKQEETYNINPPQRSRHTPRQRRHQRRIPTPQALPRKRIIKIIRIPLTQPVRQNLGLIDQRMERAFRIQRCFRGNEIEIEGLGHDCWARDWVGEDDGFDFGAEFVRGAGYGGVGVVEGGYGGDHEVCAFCCADEGCGGVLVRGWRGRSLGTGGRDGGDAVRENVVRWKGVRCDGVKEEGGRTYQVPQPEDHSAAHRYNSATAGSQRC